MFFGSDTTTCVHHSIRTEQELEYSFREIERVINTIKIQKVSTGNSSTPLQEYQNHLKSSTYLQLNTVYTHNSTDMSKKRKRTIVQLNVPN